MNTFLSSYSKMKSGSNKESARQPPRQHGSVSMNPIAELDVSDSETKTAHKEEESEEEEAFGRSDGEGIDLAKVEVTPKRLQIDVASKEGFKEMLRFQLRIFD